jgi:hypothetical protein
MSLVIDMIEWFADDTYADSFYTNLDLFNPSAEAMEAFRAVLNPAFKYCIAQSQSISLVSFDFILQGTTISNQLNPSFSQAPASSRLMLGTHSSRKMS